MPAFPGTRRWSDDQRRLACRLCFIALVLVPVLWVLQIAVAPHDPEGLVAALQSRTGLDTSLHFLRTPRPGDCEVYGLSIACGSQPPCEVGLVRAKSGQGLELYIPGTVRLTVGQLQALLDKSLDRILPDSVASLAEAAPTSLRCDRVLLSRDSSRGVAPSAAPPAELMLESLKCSLTPGPGRVRMNVSFRIAGGGSARPVELVFERSLGSHAHREHLRADTGDTFLPAWVLVPFYTEAIEWGEAAAFAGTCEGDLDAGGQLTGTVRGAVKQLDLAGLSRGSGTFLTGVADLGKLECQLDEGRIAAFSAEAWVEQVQPDPDQIRLFRSFGWQVAESMPMGANQSVGVEAWTLAINVQLSGGMMVMVPSPLNRSVIGVDRGNHPVIELVGGEPQPVPVERLAASLYGSGGEAGVPAPGLDNRMVGFLDRFRFSDGFQPAAEPVRVSREVGGTVRR